MIISDDTIKAVAALAEADREQEKQAKITYWQERVDITITRIISHLYCSQDAYDITLAENYENALEELNKLKNEGI